MWKTLWHYVDKDKVAILDITAKIYLRFLAFLSAIITFVPNFSLARVSLLVVVDVYYLVQEYAEKEKAMDIWLFIVSTGWTVRIQGVILIVFGLSLLYMLFAFTEPIVRTLGVVFYLMAAQLALELMGGAPRKKAKDKWNCLASQHRAPTTIGIDASVDQAAVSLADWSKFFAIELISSLFMIVLLSVYDTIGVHDNLSLEKNVSLAVITINIGFISDIVLKIRETSAIQCNKSLAGRILEYPKFVKEVMEENEDEKRFRSSLNPFKH